MEPFIGQIQPVGFNFAPRGWALCDGQLMAVSENSALFSLLGTIYGGDGRTTFGLPDMRGRYLRHVGSGPGLSPVSGGQKGGAESITLLASNIPSHNHFVQGTTEDATLALPTADSTFGTGSVIYSSSTQGAVALNGASITNTGGGQSFNSLNPYLGIYFCIALVGIYPSRN